MEGSKCDVHLKGCHGVFQEVIRGNKQRFLQNGMLEELGNILSEILVLCGKPFSTRSSLHGMGNNLVL